jgi:hypothetical protein
MSWAPSRGALALWLRGLSQGLLNVEDPFPRALGCLGGNCGSSAGGTFLGIASKAFLGLKGQNGEVFNGVGF